ncbi:SAM-dependent methyltransferase [Prauserella sp. PE36]|uniref:Class I SAM-dependent methyltransferase n=1 Tax=Prauserella endophytica TaxID=1592324 RepID=A0ABY2S2T3_9PSEU|nr:MULTISPECIES: class I SAM-dependent methyltransferase [Prauserella]PXY29952.1 methyltransferase type 11 [Prauserella coralliicola]RBM11525.1 SAM-dependent methyltransferase [Prauserella sp. PE36]TKG69747.1 class I SAM-dependent methyltransferase [Prauserella endophytica]
MAVNHPIFARFYSRLSRAMERGGMAEHREALLAGLSGTVLEVGAGNGLNFAHYPGTVDRVIAVEPEPHLRQLAEGEARKTAVPVEVVDGTAEQLPAGEGSVDAVVVSLVLCSVPDQASALREMRRVLVPGGKLRFLEHVRADSPGMVRVQRLLDATFWPRLAGGCHAGRDTAAAIEHAGFQIERLDRYRFPDARTPFSSHISGIAARS